MKKLLLFIFLFPAICFAENITYEFNGKTVVDVSGAKSKTQIAQEFGGQPEDWKLVEEYEPTAEEILAQKEKAEQEAMIQQKMRELAIEDLVAEGKIAADSEVAVESIGLTEDVMSL